MTGNSSHYLVIVARFPTIGKCKTRLIPALGPEGSFQFAHAALTDSLHLFSEVDVTKILLFTPVTAEREFQGYLDDQDLSTKWRLQRQSGGSDLGARLRDALGEIRVRHEQDGLNPRGSAVVFIGMDCFDLDPDHILESIKQVSASHAHMIPASDGGYVLLSIPISSSMSIFDNIRWSSKDTGQMQVQRLADCGLSCSLGTTLDDVDEPEDLKRLWQKSQGNLTNFPRTFKFLQTVMS